MPDVSQLSDAELMQRLQAPPTPQAAPQADVSALSDEELMQRLQTTQEPYSGTILPLSRDAEGNVSFDSDAGILGLGKQVVKEAWRGVTLPGDVMKGEVDPLSQEGIERAAALGTMASPVSSGVRAGTGLVPTNAVRMKKPDVKAPTREALEEAADSGYSKAREMGVDFDPQAVKQMAFTLKAELEQDGILAELAPKSFKLLRKLQNPPENSVAPLKGLEAARRSFKHAAKDFTNRTEQLAAKRIMAQLDEFMDGSVPESVLAGPAAAAGKTLQEARGNYGAAKRSEQLGGVREEAELAAATANSGANLDNAVRQRAKSILKNKKARAGFNKQELNALEKVAKGSKNRNVLRFVGNLLGGGGGLGMGVTAGLAGGSAGAAFGGPIGVAAGMAAPLAGIGAKKLANQQAMRSLGRADELVRKRSPLYEQIMRDTPAIPVRSPGQEGAIRSLMLMRPPEG